MAKAYSVFSRIRLARIGGKGASRYSALRLPRAHRRDHRLDRRFRRSEAGLVARAEDERGGEADLRLEGRVAADRHVREGVLDVGERLGDPPLAHARRHRARQHLPAGRQPRREPVEHRLHDRRHARHDVDVADREAGRLRDRIDDQLGAGGNAGHAHARLVEVGLAVALGEDRHRARVEVDRHAERLGDGIGGDVVMGRADARRWCMT